MEIGAERGLLGGVCDEFEHCVWIESERDNADIAQIRCSMFLPFRELTFFSKIPLTKDSKNKVIQTFLPLVLLPIHRHSTATNNSVCHERVDAFSELIVTLLFTTTPSCPVPMRSISQIAIFVLLSLCVFSVAFATATETTTENVTKQRATKQDPFPFPTAAIIPIVIFACPLLCILLPILICFPIIFVCALIFAVIVMLAPVVIEIVIVILIIIIIVSVIRSLTKSSRKPMTKDSTNAGYVSDFPARFLQVQPNTNQPPPASTYGGLHAHPSTAYYGIQDQQNNEHQKTDMQPQQQQWSPMNAQDNSERPGSSSPSSVD
mmetsp:Transcript_950/g.3252  ORF Transcript_950/g.3252 Transcript_950/m.3252 type:complete len:320 (+) Transcript_950:3430-4389(+)